MKIFEKYEVVGRRSSKDGSNAVKHVGHQAADGRVQRHHEVGRYCHFTVLIFYSEIMNFVPFVALGKCIPKAFSSVNSLYTFSKTPREQTRMTDSRLKIGHNRS